ncbi:MAG: hypothetical protein AABY18_06165 [Candidatus Thermoplasmatota archaeon]
MRWFTWLMPVLGVTVLILGLSLNIPQKFQASTGWIGFFVFVAAFFVLFGVEQIVDDAAR